MKPRFPDQPRRSLLAVLFALALCLCLQSCSLLMDEFFQLAKSAPRLDKQVVDMDLR